MVNEFLAFEEQNDLFNRTINGFYYWPYIRYEVFSYAFHNNIKKKQNKNTIKIKDLLTMIDLALFKNTLFLHNHFDILAMGYPRKIVQSDGKSVDPYIGPISDNIDNSLLRLERYRRQFHNVNTDNVIYLEDSELLSILYRKTLRFIDKEMINEESTHIVNLIKHSFSITISYEKIYDKLSKAFSMWKVYKKKYKKLLKRITPYCIIEAPGYADHIQILNEVAKEFHIPTIEIEHGFAREEHVAWNFSKKRMLLSSPDYFFCGSQYTKDNVRFNIPDDNIIVVGNCYLDQRVKNRKHCTDQNDILILGGLYYSEELSAFAMELAKYIKSQNYRSIHITYKTHPKDACDSNNFKILNEYYPEVEVIYGTQGKSVYDCLETAGKVVGIYTSTMFEAMAYGAEVFALESDGSKDLESFVKQGYITFVSNPKDLFENKNNNTNKSLWRSNAIENTIAELNKIIDESKSNRKQD